MELNLQTKFSFRNMTKQERRAYLAYHGITATQIAKRHRVSVSSVSYALNDLPALRSLLNRISYGLFGRQEKQQKKSAIA